VPGSWPVLSLGGDQVGDVTEKVVVAVVARDCPRCCGPLVDELEDDGALVVACESCSWSLLANGGKNPTRADLEALRWAAEVVVATNRGRRPE